MSQFSHTVLIHFSWLPIWQICNIKISGHLYCWHNLAIPSSHHNPGIILCMCPANERRRYIVTSSLIGWAHTQNDPCNGPHFNPLPATVTVDPGSMIPLLGRTQYRLGAVVFTLKHTRFSEGFVNFRSDVTTSVNGPARKKGCYKTRSQNNEEENTMHTV